MLAPEVESLPWMEQLELDDETYRTQLAYLFERSAFYREKLSTAGFESSVAAGGLAEIAQLPLTEKRELRATCTPDNPIGTHLCARHRSNLKRHLGNRCACKRAQWIARHRRGTSSHQ